nr:putative B3 domain-containing protein Os08g0325100 [Lolium perenne]
MSREKMGCERCKRRDELDYCNLDDREKHFLMFMLDGCAQEMIIPDDFLKRFRGEIPREMKLETQNGHSYTIGVAKYPDKLVLREGWGAFVETYDLHTDDCMVFRYKGDSKFDVIVFDRFGLEKASSVIVDNAPPPPRERERHNSGTENSERSHGHSLPKETPSPTEYSNHSEGRHQPMQRQPPTEDGNRSQGHPQPMRMQSPTENLDNFAGFSPPMEMQQPTENVANLCGHSHPTQMQPCTETLDHSNYHAQTVQMQLPRRRTRKQSKLQSDYSSQGNKTAMPSSSSSSSSGDSFSPADDTEVRDAARYTLGWHCTLTTMQKKEVDEKVQFIHSDNPKFVAVMRNFNVTGPVTLTFSKQYVKTYVGDKERNICLQRLNKRWKVHFGGSPILKRIESGWRKFVQENDVEVGDICIFELLKIYELCTMEVHIIRAKDFGRPSQSGDPRVEERRKDGTETVEHCHSRSHPVQMQLGNATVDDSPVHPRPIQMQSPSAEREKRVQRDNWSQGNKRDSLMAEDSGDDMDDLSGCIGVGLKHLTSIQKKAVKEKVQCIDSEIPICVAVMPRTSVTGSFNLTMSKKYVDKYLGDEVRSIWLERHREKYHVTLGRKPLNNRVVRGWAKFVRDNELEKGDICLLELLKHCKVSAMKVHIIRAKNTS